jgi:hypothetical protein
MFGKELALLNPPLLNPPALFKEWLCEELFCKTYPSIEDGRLCKDWECRL